MIKHRRLVGNSLSIFTNRIVQSLTAFILFAGIARIRGPYEVGQYTLALSYYFIFMTIASQGFKLLITRELARHPEEMPLFLGNSTLVQLVFCLIGYAALIGLVSLFPYTRATTHICYLVGLAMIPFSLSNVTEALFLGMEKAHMVAVSTVPVYILRVAISVVMMKLGYSIFTVAWIQVLSEVVILLIEWALITRSVKPVWRINREFVWRNIKAARVLIAIESFAILQSRIQVLILSLLAGEVVVGLYGAITQLLQPFQIITQSIIIGVFPRLSNSADMNMERQRRLIEKVIEVLLLVGLPLGIILFFIGGDLLVFIYRNRDFAEAAQALKVVSVSLIALALVRPLSYLLVANRLERINMREVVFTTIIGSLISIPLILNYQLIGAALAMVLVQFLALSQYMYAVYTRLFHLKVWHFAWRPLLVSAVLIAGFVLFVH